MPTPDVTPTTVLDAIADGTDCITGLATLFRVPATSATLRHTVYDLGQAGKIRYWMDGTTRRFGLALPDAVARLHAEMTEAVEGQASSNDLAQIVDDWFRANGYPTVLYR